MAAPALPPEYFVASTTTTEVPTPLTSPQQSSDYIYENPDAEPNVVGPELDPRTDPKYPKYRILFIVVSLLVIVRVAVLALLCVPWSLKCMKEYPVGYEHEYLFYHVLDIESIIIPEDLREEAMIRYVLTCIYPIDLIVCLSTSLVGFCTRNLTWLTFLCLLWFCFMLITLVFSVIGLILFITHNQFTTIFYSDVILLPAIMTLVVFIMKYLRSKTNEGYKVFTKPYKVIVDKPTDAKQMDTAPEGGEDYPPTENSLSATSGYATSRNASSTSGQNYQDSYARDPLKQSPGNFSNLNSGASSRTTSQQNIFARDVPRMEYEDKEIPRQIYRRHDYDRRDDRKYSRARDDYDRRDDRKYSRARDEYDRRDDRKSSRARDEYDRRDDRKSSRTRDDYDRRDDRKYSRARDDRKSSRARDDRKLSRARDDRKSSRDRDDDRKGERRRSKSKERREHEKKRSKRRRK